MADIGKRIRARREALNMTQEELASRLGYKSKTTIAKIENGTNDIVQSKVIEFAKVLNTTPAYLMGWKFDLFENERVSEKEPAEKVATLSPKDNRDIANDMDAILSKLRSGENGPASYDGEEIQQDDIDLFAGQLELMLKRLKAINKEKYNPEKNKK